MDQERVKSNAPVQRQFFLTTLPKPDSEKFAKTK